MLMAGCSNQISGMSLDSTGQNENEVVDNQGKVKNLQYLDDFMRSVDQQEEAKVKVTQYTQEGDPVTTQLHYEKGEVKYRHDTTQDKYGDQKVIEKSCDSISRLDRADKTVYIVKCGSEEVDILNISYNAGLQDSFDIQFVYDMENRMSLDTKEKSLSVQADLVSLKKNNFYLTNGERNRLYKLLIMENYFGDKEVTNECRESPEYSLRVVINGNEKHYQWSSCDEGQDVEAMTEMAESIAEIIKETKQYKQFFH